MKYKNTGRGIPEIANELKADYILESSVRSAGGRLRITTQLVRGSDASHVWTGEYERDLGNILDVQQKVAIAIAGEVRLSLDKGAEARLRAPRPMDAEAYQDYLLGRFYWNKRNRLSAIPNMPLHTPVWPTPTLFLAGDISPTSKPTARLGMLPAKLSNWTAPFLRLTPH